MKNKKRNKRTSPARTQSIMRSIKGAIMGLIFSVICVLLFALIVKQTDVSAEIISAVNQIIKVCAIFMSACIATKNLQEFKLIAGAATGSAYVVLAYLVFSLVEGQFGDVLIMFADLAMGVAIGLLTAAIFGKLSKATPLVNKRA